MTELDEVLALQATGDGAWTADTDSRYEANSGAMFGGWVAAVLLNAALGDNRAQGTPAALSVNFLKPVPPGSKPVIKTRLVRGGRSLSFWQAEIFAGQEQAAFATIVLANRRATDGFTEHVMPRVPEPEALPIYSPPAGRWGERVVTRPVSGLPPFNRPDTRSMHWVREPSGRAMDYLQLALLSDAYQPRIYFKSAEVRPAATITMSVYFYAGEAELRAVGDDYILNEAIGMRAELSTIGQRARLWSRKGQLLATTEQLQWFK